ncbi:MAG: oxidoreductase [Steroidobacteraceae bacterium]|nr:oxidoreductase [Steroidobacteraceae bacterium]
MGRLQGKGAVILGAAGRDNMGQVMARTFAREGARVLVAGRHEDSLRQLATEIGGRHVVCDITRKSDVEALADAAVAAFGKVDVAVNCTKSAGGSVIQISSASVHCLLNNHAAYIATKAAGEALVRCFANEFGAQGVRVNSIAPGLTSTPMTEKDVHMPGLEEAFLKEYPLGRIGTTQDIADAALWLAGDECFLTGQVLQVNGGLTLRRNPTQKEISASLRAHAPPRPGS